MSRRTLDVALALVLTTISPLGCSRVKTTVDVYRGELPSYRLRAVELDALATQFVGSAAAAASAVKDDLAAACTSLLDVQQQRAADDERLKAASRTAEYQARGAEFLAKVQACTRAKYDAKKCGEMVAAARSLADRATILDTIGAAHASPSAREKYREFMGLVFEPRPADATKIAARTAAIEKAHAAYLLEDVALTVSSWEVRGTTFEEELVPVFTELKHVCDAHQAELDRLADELREHDTQLQKLAPPADAVEANGKETPAAAASHRAYAAGVTAEITALRRLRFPLVGAAEATAAEIEASLRVLGAVEPAVGSLSAVPALRDSLRALGALEDTMHSKIDPRDPNIPVITSRDNRKLWNRIDVDRMKVHAAGRSRFIIVQDSAINFRLKELNSDPTSVVKFGLTAADIGLAVLSTVITKRPTTPKGDSSGGSTAAAEPAVDPVVVTRLADQTEAKVKAIRSHLLRELTMLEVGLSGALRPDQVKERAERLELLLELFAGDLKNAAAVSPSKPTTTVGEASTSATTPANKEP